MARKSILLISLILAGSLAACSDSSSNLPKTSQVEGCIDKLGDSWQGWGRDGPERVLKVRRLDGSFIPDGRYNLEFEADIESAKGSTLRGVAQFQPKESGWVCVGLPDFKYQ